MPLSFGAMPMYSWHSCTRFLRTWARCGSLCATHDCTALAPMKCSVNLVYCSGSCAIGTEMCHRFFIFHVSRIAQPPSATCLMACRLSLYPAPSFRCCAVTHSTRLCWFPCAPPSPDPMLRIDARRCSTCFRTLNAATGCASLSRNSTSSGARSPTGSRAPAPAIPGPGGGGAPPAARALAPAGGRGPAGPAGLPSEF